MIIGKTSRLPECKEGIAVSRRAKVGSQGEPLADDLLSGAAAIAKFVYGDERERRKVYGLVESGQLPVFRWGATIHARKSTIMRDIATRERAAKVLVDSAE
jgi:hypothetical protein